MAVLLSAIPAPGAPPAAPTWETVVVREGDASDQTAPQAASLDVEYRDGYVFITVDREVVVEVYTILGQLVTRRKVLPGVVRLSLGHRGVYILKAGSTTKRINI